MVTRAGVKARSELRAARSTDVAKEILQGARDFGADTIVLGSRGLGDLTGMLLGGVAHRVIQLADCPVVVVRAVEATAGSRDRDRGRAATAA
jgi:nucleotide-binding universal stress UspA family protein